MLTIDDLKRFGADTEAALARCMQNETFYLTLVGKALNDDSMEKLENAVGRGDLNEAFEIAHSLKGVFGNLSLTPLYEDIAEITELLRNKTQTDYTPYLCSASEKFNRLREFNRS